MTEQIFSRATDLKVEINYLAELKSLILNSSTTGNVLIAYRVKDGSHVNEAVLRDEIAKEFLAILNNKQDELRNEFNKL